MSFRAEYSSGMMTTYCEDRDEEPRNLIPEQHEPYWGRHIIVICKVFEILAK